MIKTVITSNKHYFTKSVYETNNPEWGKDQELGSVVGTTSLWLYKLKTDL